jgi:hypothetical protein
LRRSSQASSFNEERRSSTFSGRFTGTFCFGFSAAKPATNLGRRSLRQDQDSKPNRVRRKFFDVIFLAGLLPEWKYRSDKIRSLKIAGSRSPCAL